MTSRPIASVSGVRGVIGESLTPEIALPFVRAFAAAIKGKKVVLGSDSRPSRAWLYPLVESALVASGKEVHSLGICPTPTVGIAIRQLKAAGGIVITASHNPIVYNGLKFFHSGGEFFTEADNRRLQKILKSGKWLNPDVHGTGWLIEETGALDWHIKKVLKALGKAAGADGRSGRASRGGKRGRAKVLKVVVDCCNAAGSVIAPKLLRELGCEVVELYTDPSKPFPHEPEPLPKNLKALGRTVRKHKADLGFALDPDADRLALIDEKGEPLGEERTLVLAADAFFTLAKGKDKKGPFVVNLSCSQAMDDVGTKHGVKVPRTRIGEAHVVAGIHKHGAPLGGEGNGGVIFPAVHPGRDAATAMAWILAALRLHGGTISELNATLPDYVMIRDKFSIAKLSLGKVLKAARAEFKDAEKVFDLDGLKFQWSDRWLHIRPSNTEPIVRMTAEAPTAAAAKTLMKRGGKAFGK